MKKRIEPIKKHTEIPIFDTIINKINEIISDVNDTHDEENNLTRVEKERILEDQLSYLTTTIDGKIHGAINVTLDNFKQFSYDDFKNEIRSEEAYTICMSIIRKLSKELKR